MRHIRCSFCSLYISSIIVIILKRKINHLFGYKFFGDRLLNRFLFAFGLNAHLVGWLLMAVYCGYAMNLDIAAKRRQM